MVTMRRTAFLVLLLVFACSAAFAQQRAEQKVYVKTVPIAKVYPHALGYRILYFKSTLEYGEMYVPSAWFKFDGVGKGALVWGNTDEFPYMAIYYADGKFDRIVLYLHKNMQHISWGSLPPGIDLASKFDVQEPPRDF
jgi:hypothetical protein